MIAVMYARHFLPLLECRCIYKLAYKKDAAQVIYVVVVNVWRIAESIDSAAGIYLKYLWCIWANPANC